MARFGDVEAALRLLDEVISSDPKFSDAIEARAELLDIHGDREQADAGYAESRRLKSAVRRGAPDRPFALRQRGDFMVEVLSYDIVLRSMTKNALPYLTRGNAYLASGYPAKALADYDSALSVKPGLLDATLLRAEALLQLGRVDDALAAVEVVVAARPSSPEAFSTRALIELTRGQLEKANADWQRQLKILNGRPAPSGYVALRLADYEAAIPHLEAASQADPRDPYWKLYLNTARIRTGRPAVTTAVTQEGWPETLLALQAGTLSEDAALAKADTTARRAEALFQIAVLKSATDPAAARSRWQEVVERGPHDLVEYAAARNELARVS